MSAACRRHSDIDFAGHWARTVQQEGFVLKKKVLIIKIDVEADETGTHQHRREMVDSPKKRESCWHAHTSIWQPDILRGTVLVFHQSGKGYNVHQAEPFGVLVEFLF